MEEHTNQLNFYKWTPEPGTPEYVGVKLQTRLCSGVELSTQEFSGAGSWEKSFREPDFSTLSQ